MAVFIGETTGNPYEADMAKGDIGGEGTFYPVTNSTVGALKIYHKPTRERERKLSEIIRRMPDWEAQGMFAWPLEPVRGADGKFAGFAMRLVRGDGDISAFYERCGAEALGRSYADQVLIAANLARAYAVAHSVGVAVGDANVKNALVVGNEVVLIDCDGFLYEGGSPYGTGWVEDASAPETHASERAGRGYYYDKNTDLFTLAERAFRLVMNDFSPFACRTTDGSLDRPTLKEAIVARTFFYDPADPSDLQSGRLAVPVGAPDYMGLVPDRMRAMFKKAFTATDPAERPSAEAWVDALESFHEVVRRAERRRKSAAARPLSHGARRAARAPTARRAEPFARVCAVAIVVLPLAILFAFAFSGGAPKEVGAVQKAATAQGAASPEMGGVDGVGMEEDASETEREDGQASPSESDFPDEAEVVRMGKHETRYAINELYARHGYEFTDDEWREVFEEEPWYDPEPGKTQEQAEAEFSDEELAYRDRLVLHEARCGWR